MDADGCQHPTFTFWEANKQWLQIGVDRHYPRVLFWKAEKRLVGGRHYPISLFGRQKMDGCTSLFGRQVCNGCTSLPSAYIAFWEAEKRMAAHGCHHPISLFGRQKNGCTSLPSHCIAAEREWSQMVAIAQHCILGGRQKNGCR